MAHTILVIDDEPALRDLAEALLDEWGYSVLLAESGQAALRLLNGKPDKADAVLLDMTMPGLSPEETLQGLHAINPALPVIVLSAHSEQTVRSRLECAVIAGYLQKPYEESGLRAMLAKAIPAAQARSEVTRPAPALFKIQPLADEERQEMASEFLAARQRELPRLTEYLQASDFEQLRIIGHTLKGSGGCFGFERLTALGGALERCAEIADLPGCRQQVELLADSLSPFRGVSG